MRNANAMGQQWGQVGVTSSRLHRDGLPPSTTQGGGRGPTLRRSCRQQTQSLSQALLLYAYERLQLGHKAAERLASLCTQHSLVTTRCAFVSIRPKSPWPRVHPCRDGHPRSPPALLRAHAWPLGQLHRRCHQGAQRLRPWTLHGGWFIAWYVWLLRKGKNLCLSVLSGTSLFSCSLFPVSRLLPLALNS